MSDHIWPIDHGQSRVSYLCRKAVTPTISLGVEPSATRVASPLSPTGDRLSDSLSVSVVRDLGSGPSDGFDGFRGKDGSGEEREEDSLSISGGVDGVERGEVGITDSGFVDEEFGGAGEDAGFVAIAVDAGNLGEQGRLGSGRGAEEFENGAGTVVVGMHGG